MSCGGRRIGAASNRALPVGLVYVSRSIRRTQLLHGGLLLRARVPIYPAPQHRRRAGPLRVRSRDTNSGGLGVELRCGATPCRVGTQRRALRRFQYSSSISGASSRSSAEMAGVSSCSLTGVRGAASGGRLTVDPVCRASSASAIEVTIRSGAGDPSASPSVAMRTFAATAVMRSGSAPMTTSCRAPRASRSRESGAPSAWATMTTTYDGQARNALPRHPAGVRPRDAVSDHPHG